MLKRCTVVKKQGFGGSRKVPFFDPKMDVKKHEISFKIWPWGAIGLIFLDFRRFLKGSFFDGFRDRKKWVQNLEKSGKSGPEGWPRWVGTSRAEAKEGGGGEVNLPPGSEG